MAKVKLENEYKLWLVLGGLLLLVVGSLYLASRTPTEGGESLWKVISVRDDKSFVVKGSGQTFAFTILGLSIPESQTDTVQAYLKSTLVDKWVRLKPLRDLEKQGKAGFVYLNGEDIAARMIRQGLAKVDQSETAFDVRHFMELEESAMRDKKGLWAQSPSGVK